TPECIREAVLVKGVAEVLLQTICGAAQISTLIGRTELRNGGT
ncbi:hypothetical protein TMEN_2734, partial [Trichophyton mentagrophytes]